MDLFELNRIANKLLMKFPWNKDHGKIAVQIHRDHLRVSGSGDAVTLIIHSDILTDIEKEVIVYEIEDEIFVG